MRWLCAYATMISICGAGIFELLGNLIDADAVIEIGDNRADRHPSAMQHRCAALFVRADKPPIRRAPPALL